MTFDVFALEIFVDGGGGSSSEPTVGLDFITIGCNCRLIGSNHTVPNEVLAVDIFGGWGRGGGQCV